MAMALSWQVFARQAEALLKLHRHEEADSIMSAAPKFGMDEHTRFFGAVAKAYVLMVQAQVDMVTGRFNDAVAAAQVAARLDPGSREIGAVVRRTRAVAMARSRGNELFRAAKFAEACVAYGDGLSQDPHNAVLLYNRATCRSKLGHYEQAIEDCSTALAVRPSYSKARLRRADCNAKVSNSAMLRSLLSGPRIDVISIDRLLVGEVGGIGEGLWSADPRDSRG